MKPKRRKTLLGPSPHSARCALCGKPREKHFGLGAWCHVRAGKGAQFTPRASRPRGFAVMSRARVREIAALGGQAIASVPGHMARIGAIGGAGRGGWRKSARKERR